VLVYWLGRAFFLTGRGEMRQDPVMFAATDRISLILGMLVVRIFSGRPLARDELPVPMSLVFRQYPVCNTLYCPNIFSLTLEQFSIAAIVMKLHPFAWSAHSPDVDFTISIPVMMRRVRRPIR
jgi:hypothetical protein